MQKRLGGKTARALVLTDLSALRIASCCCTQHEIGLTPHVATAFTPLRSEISADYATAS